MVHARYLGEEHLPASGALLLPNRLSPHEMTGLAEHFGERKLTWLVEGASQLDPAMQAILNGPEVRSLRFDASARQPGEFYARLRQGLSEGEWLVFVPGKVICRAGTLWETPSELQEFLLGAGEPVLPVFFGRPGNPKLSIETASEDASTVVFGPLLEKKELTVARLQEEWLLAGERAFAERESLEASLAYSVMLGIKKHGSRPVVFDGVDKSETGYDKVLAAALALAAYVKKATRKPRVGIALPPGRAGLIANLAVLIAGKVPVNLNYSASRAAVESAMKQADLDRFLTVDLFVRKLQSFPWPPNRHLIFVERVLPKMKPKIIGWLVLSKLLPVGLLASLAGVAKRGGDEEAVLLFTSGSSGDPKGVVLTHRNVLSNVIQFATRLDQSDEDVVLGTLPLFHSFGCTVTLWFPLMEGLSLATFPTPLEVPKIADLIERRKATLLLSTPTFLRGYLRKVDPEKLRSVKLCVTGAEKLPPAVAEAFEKKFGIEVCEGYGLTETSPATNVNLPDLPAADGYPVIPSRRLGSVGQLLPGLAVRITDTSTEAPLPLHEQGMIWFKGGNVFPGYYQQPEKTAEVFEGDWFRTGDIGRFDEDGFLYIEGRLSRFSKIGGEMIPHETVEIAIMKELGIDEDAERKVVVMGAPDEAKGEMLVLLSTIAGETVNQEMIDLRYRLIENDFPSLWIPKKLVKVEEIPVLASGKLDLKRCQELIEKVV
ncbi:MAG: AMP-binding protein [Verrucomicrobiota bacterium]